jgi:allantoin racemase
MKILVINPNTTTSMTDKIAAAARDIARPDTEIIAANSQDGPASIQGFLDVATCIPGLLAEVSRHPDVDAIVIACLMTPASMRCGHLSRCPSWGLARPPIMWRV